MKKILITGGAGAIGSNLARFLLQQNYQVVILDDLSSGHYDNIRGLDLSFIKGSILDVTLLEDLFKKEKFDVVFHLAAFFANQNSVDHPCSDLSVNGLGILNMLQCATKYDVQRFVYTSSSCVYGSMDIMVESASLPIMELDTPYATTKLLGEQYCQFFAKHHGLSTVCLRLFNSYGPGEKPGQYRNVIPNFIHRALAGQNLVITGTGEETRDFTYVGDIVYGIFRSAFVDLKKGEVMNLGSGRQTSILDVATNINKIANNNAEIIFHARRSWDVVKNRVAIIEKAKQLINFNPKVSLNEGLEKTFQWFLTYD
jgi:UDP-glucose 4-epimerase